MKFAQRAWGAPRSGNVVVSRTSQAQAYLAHQEPTTPLGPYSPTDFLGIDMPESKEGMRLPR
jgi:hypothetical protein